MTTRCKFICQSVKKSKGYNEPLTYIYEAEFIPVTSGSEENDKFYKWTPGGNLKLSVYKDDRFLPGTEYYIDICEATPVEKYNRLQE